MHVLSHTHWDREWYQEFQGYRQRLVFQTDRMMDLLEARPQFRHFHLDGQTCVLEDYLEIRPEMARSLGNHVRSGRVLIGPWYVMPDERLLSGESLVRNLLLGHRICRRWNAKPMSIGYVTDVFGHCSQFPQILRGFGINAAMLHRGTSCANEKSEMVWEGADGSVVLLVAVYQYTGYNDFMTFREWTDEELRAYEKKKLSLATTNVLYALDGNDHQPAKWDVPEEIARVNRVFSRIRCVHSSMPRFLGALWKALGANWRNGRKRFIGELTLPAREGQWSETMYGFGSSRVYIKQANDALEYLLPRAAEFFHAWAAVAGAQSQKAFLDRAWRYLLLNHPHDSICGCSIDQVHRDMMYRFDQARLLATDSVWESVQALGDRIDSAALGESDAVVTLFNPGAADTGPVTGFSFDLKSDLVAQQESKGLAPVLVDGQGREVCLDTLEVERRVKAQPFAFITRDLEGVLPWVKHKPLVPTPAYRGRWEAVDRFHAAAALCVPALGYKSWRVVFRPKKRIGAHRPGVRPVKADAAAGTLENEFLKLSVKRDGTVGLYDKVTGVRYRGLHVFEDCGDAGEGWNHRYPSKDRLLLSTSRSAASGFSVKVRRTGALCATVTAAVNMRVPADLVDAETGRLFTGREKKTARSRRLRTLAIVTTFALYAGARRVDCRTTVRNSAQCHRLRVLFPTRRKTDVWFGDSAFDIVRRKIKLIDTTGWKEEARPEQVIKNFAAAADRRGGLAVVTRGLNEAAVKDDRERTLALTLFRAFRENLSNEITRESQLPGTVTAEYAIMPFTPERGAAPAGIFADVERFKMPVYSYTREAKPGEAPAEARFADVSAPAAVSTIKTSEDGKAVVVRVFNPAVRAAVVAVRPGFAFRSAWKTDLQEKAVERLRVGGNGAAKVRMRAKEVATLRFQLA